jgi:hypothetical protein
MSFEPLDSETPWHEFRDLLQSRENDYPTHDRTFVTSEWTLTPTTNKSVQSARTIHADLDVVNVVMHMFHTVKAGSGPDDYESYYRAENALKFVHEFIQVAGHCVASHIQHLNDEMDEFSKCSERSIHVTHRHHFRGKYGEFAIFLSGQNDGLTTNIGLEGRVNVPNMQFRNGEPPVRITLWMPLWERRLRGWSIGDGQSLHPYVVSAAQYDAREDWIPVQVSLIELKQGFADTFLWGNKHITEDDIIFRQRESPLFVGYELASATKVSL